jgi:hypothetical protein
VTTPEPVDLTQLRAEVTRLQLANDAELTALQAQGAGVNVAMIRLLVLLDGLLGPADGDGATERRLSYELACQQQFAAVIAELKPQVARRTLLAPGGPIPSNGRAL